MSQSIINTELSIEDQQALRVRRFLMASVALLVWVRLMVVVMAASEPSLRMTRVVMPRICFRCWDNFRA